MGREGGRYINAIRVALKGEVGGELGHGRLGGPVKGVSRGGHEGDVGGGEDDTAPEGVGLHVRHEVVGHVDVGGDVALPVSMQGGNGGLGKGPGNHVALGG